MPTFLRRPLVAFAAVVAVALAVVAAPPALSHQGHGDTFRDDDGNSHEGYIEAIAEDGITAGCGSSDTNYCPGSSVNRGQMATFLARALDLDTSGDADHFTDDDGTAFESAINAVADAGITSGCGGTSFCPAQAVTRGQMAAFLVRAFDLPAADGSTDFDDDDGSSFEDDIEALAAAGVTGGCGDNRYCPGAPVRRDQMASFLGRALGLTPADIDHGAGGGTGDTTADAEQMFVELAASRVHSRGTDTWQVWECNVPEDSFAEEAEDYGDERVDIDPAAAASFLERHMSGYFGWLSEGLYDPTFTVGGSFEIDPDADSADAACQEEALERASGANGAFVVVDLPHAGGLASAGVFCVGGCPTTVPDNQRLALVGAYAVTVDPDTGYADASTAAHELLHALDVPHSFVNDGSGSEDTEYNNPIDGMGAFEFSSVVDGALALGGTLGVNRWALGWIEDADAVLHRSGTATYTIGAIGSGLSQIIAVESADEAAWIAIDVRQAADYDRALEEEGVTVHAIDQRPQTCVEPYEGACWGVDRRQQQLPPNPDTHDHVLDVGESLTTSGITITVLKETAAGFEVRVDGTAAFAPLDPSVQ